MKRLIAAALAALISFSAQAITYVPIVTLNPAGSTAGQFIVSTGPTTGPTWGTVTLTGLGGLAKANNLSDVASTTTALANLGGLSTTTAASTYLTQASAATTYGAKASPLSQFAATTSAQLAGVISDETGTGSVVLGTGPTINQPNLVGVTSGAAAAAGSVGQIIPATATAVSLSSGIPANATSISLTAGQWDVYGSCRFVPAGTTTVNSIFAGANTTSATFPASPLFAVFTNSTASVFTGTTLSLTIPSQPFTVSTTTTVFMVVQAGFGASTMTVDCNLWGERRR